MTHNHWTHKILAAKFWLIPQFTEFRIQRQLFHEHECVRGLKVESNSYNAGGIPDQFNVLYVIHWNNDLNRNLTNNRRQKSNFFVNEISRVSSISLDMQRILVENDVYNLQTISCMNSVIMAAPSTARRSNVTSLWDKNICILQRSHCSHFRSFRDYQSVKIMKTKKGVSIDASISGGIQQPRVEVIDQDQSMIRTAGNSLAPIVDDQKLIAPQKKSVVKSSPGKLSSKLLESKLVRLIRPANNRISAADESSAIKSPHDIDCSRQHNLAMSSATELTISSSTEPSHSRLNLEPIRVQIISYIKLLRKMTANHP